MLQILWEIWEQIRFFCLRDVVVEKSGLTSIHQSEWLIWLESKVEKSAAAGTRLYSLYSLKKDNTAWGTRNCHGFLKKLSCKHQTMGCQCAAFQRTTKNIQRVNPERSMNVKVFPFLHFGDIHVLQIGAFDFWEEERYCTCSPLTGFDRISH